MKTFKKKSDLIFESKKVVFYLFNAQSNCGIVSRRDLTHIFVTHGESHKLASIKPIIRIYDFVITSGQVGIERFLKSHIFNDSNIKDENRVIPMGNTFIGQPSYEYQKDSSTLLYAPTWEGGVPSENYSSIGEQAKNSLINIIQDNNIYKVYIQLHPNLGHRDEIYIKSLIKMANELKKFNLEIIFIKSVIKFKDYFYFRNFKCIPKWKINRKIKISLAIVDISAMEMQLLSDNIPTIVFYNAHSLKELIIPSRIKCLYNLNHSLDFYDFKNYDLKKRVAETNQNKDYFFSYFNGNLENMTFRQRIHWLCDTTVQKKMALQFQQEVKY